MAKQNKLKSLSEILNINSEQYDYSDLTEKYKGWVEASKASTSSTSMQTKTQEAKPTVANTEYKPTGVLGIERGEFQQIAKELPKAPAQTAKPTTIQIPTSSTSQKPSIISSAKTKPSDVLGGILGLDKGEFQKEINIKTQSQSTVTQPAKSSNLLKAIGTGIMAGVSQQNLGIFQIPRLIYNTASFITDNILNLIFPGQIKDENNKIKMALNKAVEHYSNESKKYYSELEKMGGTEKVVGQAVATLPQVFTTILTANALTGTSLASKLPELTKMIGFGATAAGQYAREAEERGATLPKQLAYGLLGGAAEMATESLPLEYALETISKTAPKITLNLMKKGINNVLKDFGILGLEVIRNAAMEAAEEAVNDPLIGLIDKAILDKSKPYLGEEGIINLRSMKESAIAGGVAGLLLTSLGMPFSVAHSVLENRIRNNQPINSDDLLNITKDFIKNITGKDLDVSIEEIKGKKYIVFDQKDFEELQNELKQKLEKTTLEKPEIKTETEIKDEVQPTPTVTQATTTEVKKPNKLKLSDEAKQVLNNIIDKVNIQSQAPEVEQKDVADTIKEAIDEVLENKKENIGPEIKQKIPTEEIQKISESTENQTNIEESPKTEEIKYPIQKNIINAESEKTKNIEELTPQELIEELKKHEKNGFLDRYNPDTIRLLALLGTKETGVRLAKADEVGIMRYLLKKNEITKEEWIKYLKDLLKSNEIRDYDLLKRNYPEVFEEEINKQENISNENWRENIEKLINNFNNVFKSIFTEKGVNGLSKEQEKLSKDISNIIDNAPIDEVLNYLLNEYRKRSNVENAINPDFYIRNAIYTQIVKIVRDLANKIDPQLNEQDIHEVILQYIHGLTNDVQSSLQKKSIARKKAIEENEKKKTAIPEYDSNNVVTLDNFKIGPLTPKRLIAGYRFINTDKWIGTEYWIIDKNKLPEKLTKKIEEAIEKMKSEKNLKEINAEDIERVIEGVEPEYKLTPIGAEDDKTPKILLKKQGENQLTGMVINAYYYEIAKRANAELYTSKFKEDRGYASNIILMVKNNDVIGIIFPISFQKKFEISFEGVIKKLEAIKQYESKEKGQEAEEHINVIENSSKDILKPETENKQLQTEKTEATAEKPSDKTQEKQAKQEQTEKESQQATEKPSEKPSNENLEEIKEKAEAKQKIPDIAKLINESKLPEIEPTIIKNTYKNGYPHKSVLEIKRISDGVAVVGYAKPNFISKNEAEHSIRHGFVIDGKKIQFIGNAEDVIKYAKSFHGETGNETYPLRELFKKYNYKWDNKKKSWINKGGIASEKGEKEIYISITGLDNRLALRDARDGEEGYERLAITRGKILADDEAYKLDEKISNVLRKHQIDGARLAIAAIENYGGFLLADGTGAGKTMQELAVADYFSKKGKVLIVTINRGIINNAFKKDAATLGLKVNEIEDKLGNGINITTYASLNKIKEQPDYIIFDEAHSLKNQGSIRAKKGIKLIEKAKGVLFASATPIDKAEHIYYLEKMGLFTRKTFSQIMNDLGYKYVERNVGRRKIGMWERKVSLEEAEQRLDNLFSELSDLGLMVKREVLMDKISVEFKQIKLSSEAYKILDMIEHFYDMTIKNKGLRKALALMAQRRFQEPYKKDIVLKLTEEELQKGRQVIIFATRIEETEVSTPLPAYEKLTLKSEGTLNTLVQEFEKRGIQVSKIFGSGKIDSEINNFQEGKTKVALVTPQKGGAGLSLDDTKGDSPRTMIVITAPFSAVDNVQMAGRVNRLNTKSNSKIIYLMADTPIDEWNKEIIVEKMKTLKASVKGEIEKLDLSNVNIDIDENEIKSSLEQMANEVINSEIIEEDEEEVIGYSPKAESIKQIVSKATNPAYKKAQAIQKTPLQRVEIAEEVAEILNIPVRFKRLSLKKALGEFKIRPEVIRLKGVDIDTLAHEVGHYLDKKFNISDLMVRYPYEAQTLTSGVETNDVNFTKEAFAEFMRLYLTQPQNIDDIAPKFKDEFENIVKSIPELKEVMDKAQEVYSQYYSQSIEERAANFVSFKPKNKKFKINLEDFYKALIDEAKPLQKFTEEVLKEVGTIPASMNPYIRYRLLKGWAGKAMANLEYGVTNPETLKVIGPSFKEIVDAFNNEQELQDFSRYLAYIRALELNNRGINSGLTNEEAQQGLITLRKKYEKDFAKFKKQAKKIYEYNKSLLKTLQIAGIIDKATYNKIISQNKFYVPFFRVNKEGVNTKTKNVVDINKPVYKIKGSNAEIINPLESIIKLTYIFTSVAERNLTANTIATLAETVPGLGKYVEKVPPKMQPIQVNAKEVLEKLEKLILGNTALGDTASITKELDLEDIFVTLFKPVLKGHKAENVAVIYRDGKPQLYQFDKDLYDLLAAVDNETKGIWGKLLKAFSYPASLLRSGAVLTPDFAMKNILRDQLSAYMYSKYGYIPYFDMIKGLSHVLKRDDLYKEFYRSGAAQAALASIDRNYLRRSISKMLTEKDIKGTVKEYVTNPLILLQQIAEASEESTRIGEFKKGYERELRNIQNEIAEYEAKLEQYKQQLYALQKQKNKIGTNVNDEIYRIQGKIKLFEKALEYLLNNSEAEAKRRAAFAAREVTLDFRRAGKYSKELNKVIAFLNPSIQGIDKMMREFKTNPMKIISRGIPLTVATLLLFLANKDNEYYEEIPQWEKDLFWHIPITPKKFIRIPKPQELGIIFSTIPQRFLEYAYSKDPTAFRELDNAIYEQLALGLPKVFKGEIPNGIVPTAIVPILEIYANKSLFTNLPIVPEREKNIEPKYQYSSNTSEVAKFIGKLLNVSPRYIDQAVYDYTGGLGRNTLDFIDVIMGKKKAKETIETIPGIRGLVSKYPTASQSTTIQKFYDDYNRAEKLLATAKKYYEETDQRYKLDKDDKAFVERIAGDIDNFNTALSRMRKLARKLSEIRKAIRNIQADNSLSTIEKIEKIKELELQQMNIVREFYGEEPLE